MPCVVVIRDKATLLIEESDFAVMAVPAGWFVENAGSGWFVLWPGGVPTPGATRYVTRMVIDGADIGQPARALWVVCPIDGRGWTRLKNFALNSPNAWTIRELRADNGSAATTIKSVWQDMRPREGGEGSVIPDHAGTEIVAIRTTIFGLDSHTDSELYSTLVDIPDSDDNAAAALLSAFGRGRRNP